MAFGKTSKGDILDVEKAVIILYGENNCQKKIPVLFNRLIIIYPEMLTMLNLIFQELTVLLCSLLTEEKRH